jgi:hypothetical protein
MVCGILLAFAPSIARASCDIDDLVGYTIVEKKTISGRIDDGVKSDDYQGCQYGRIILFDDGTGVKCHTYSYSYAYRPTAYIVANQGGAKICVEGQLLDVGPPN